MNNSPIPNFLFLSHPMLNVLVLIYKIIFSLHIPFALGFSIIALTIVIRFILYPLTSSQLKASRKMQELTPHLNKLKDLHKGDSKRIQQETMKLYKERGVNPLAGCLPTLVQLPIIWALYNVLQDIVKYSTTQINAVLYSDTLKLAKPWDTTFLGLPLSKSPSNLLSTVGVIVLLVPILTGLFQFIQSKMLFPAVKPGAVAEPKKKDDFASAFQSQSTYIFPIMIGFFSFTFPLGLSLYWNTFTIFGIIQQYKILGPGSLVGLIDKGRQIYGKRHK